MEVIAAVLPGVAEHQLPGVTPGRAHFSITATHMATSAHTLVLSVLLQTLLILRTLRKRTQGGDVIQIMLLNEVLTRVLNLNLILILLLFYLPLFLFYLPVLHVVISP